MGEDERGDGYKRRAERDAGLAAELAGVSAEATELLGDVPDW
jgi:hypothetical protein